MNLIAPVLYAFNGVGQVCTNPRLEKSPWSQSISDEEEDTARYSASVEDLETHSYFFHFHEIKAPRRYMHDPVVDRRVSEQPT